MSTTDTVVLRFPRKSQYYSIARLVVGGLAAPLEMSYDALDDLQLAVSTLLDSTELDANHELTLRLQVGPDRMQASLGAFDTGVVLGAFERSHQRGGEFDLRRLLDTIVDDISIDEVDECEWVTLTKHVKAVV
jgi:anti-sigma regulatory factor (Ser/Thr protein kinase)